MKDQKEPRYDGVTKYAQEESTPTNDGTPPGVPPDDPHPPGHPPPGPDRPPPPHPGHHPPPPPGPHGPHPGHLHPPHHHHHVPAFFIALEELVRAGHIGSLSEMIAFADRFQEQEISSMLAGIAASDPEQPIDLVLKELHLNLEKRSVKAAQARKSLLSGSKVGVFPPLPPHVLDEFKIVRLTLLNPGAHGLEPHWRKLALAQILTPRACRGYLSQMDALLFEGFKHDGVFYVPMPVADVLDYIPSDLNLKLFIHPRPHRHNGDVPTTIKQYEEIH